MALTNLSQVTSSGIHTLSSYTTHNINSTGIITATEFSGNLSSASGISTFSEIRVTGNLTVEGTTTTLDSVLNEVDRLEIGANTTAVGLAVTQSGTGHVATFEGGNVGMGTDNPTSALEIRTTTTNAATHYRNNASNGGAYFGVRATDLGAADAGEAYVYSYNSGINLLADGNGDINFATGGTASRVRIKDNGNTGIGTDNPVALLNPHGTAELTNTDQVVLISDSNADDAIGRGGNLGFAGYVNGNLRTLAGIGGLKRNAGNSFNGDLVFYTRVNGQPNLYPRLRILSDGNVGIGTNNPASILDVYKNFSGVSGGTYAGRVYGLDSGVSETSVRFVTKGTGDLHNASDAYLMHGISNGITRFVFGANGNIGIGGTEIPNSTIDIISPQFDLSGNVNASTHNQNSGITVQANAGDAPGAAGAGIRFAQRWWSGSIHNIVTAGIFGYKRNSSGQFGGGLKIATSSGTAANLTTRMTIDDSGKVGIGTDTPGAKLHTYGGDAIIENVGGITLKFRRDDTSTASNRLIGAIQFEGNDSNGAYETGAIIKASTEAAHGTGDKPSRLEFHTTPDNSATPVERLRIKSDGKLMTQSAGYVYTASSSGSLSLYGGNTNLGGGIILGGGNGNADIRFLAQASTATPAERLRITSTGNVGIGTDNPDELLEVGDGTVSGALKVSGQSSSVTSDGFTVDWESSSNSTRFFSEPSSGGSSAIRFFTTSSGTRAERLRIDSAGKTGINASSPQQRLDVVGLAHTVAVFRPDASTVSAYGNASAVNNLINLRMPYGENPGSTNHGGARWGIKFQGINDGSSYGTDTSKSASIYGVSEDTLGYNRQVGLAFYTSDFDVNQTERLRITSDGKVGINVTSPTTNLQIGDGTVDSDNVLKFGKRVSSNEGNLPMIGHHSHNGTASSLALSATSSSGCIHFFTGNDADGFGDGNNEERLRIAANGDLSFQQGTYIAGTVEKKFTYYSKAGTTGASVTGSNAEIAFVKKDSWDTTWTSYGEIAFRVNSDSRTALDDALYINYSRKVGIPAVAESSALLGINGASTSELTNSSPLYNQGNPCYLQIKNTTDDISDPECGIILQPRNSANGSVAIYAKRTGSYISDLVYRVRTGASTSAERLRIKNDGNVAIGIANPESKVHIRSTTSYGKDSYATANTGGSQTPPAGTFRWDNSTPVGSNGRGYHAWVQSGDAYPNASNYIDVLIRNGGFYRITLKRSHSSAEASVCQMMIYGLANNTNAQYPVVHMTGASGSGTSHSTVQSGGGRGSSNAVGSFYWEVHSYNVNSYDTIIRITTTGNNNQGIVALIERI